MAKTKISNGDLTALFFDEMRQSADCPLGMSVAKSQINPAGKL
jgi:hypothetical protein